MDTDVARAIQDDYRRFFEEKAARHGEDLRTLGLNPASQEQRFDVLAGVGVLAGRDLLDVGCGFADFLGYLQRKGTAVRSYTGVDIAPSVLAVARQRYPSASFIEGDFQSQAPSTGFDFVVASGVFFLPNPRWEEYMLEGVRRMYESARIGVAVNFLSDRSRKPDGVSYYANAPRVLELLQRNLTACVVLRHDYRVNDFTVYLYRREFL